MKHFLIFFNSNSGSGEQEELKQFFSVLSPAVKVTWIPIATLNQFSLDHILSENEKADAVLAAGGDGTANLLAQKTAKSTQSPSLGILPLGTFNYFARYLYGDCTIQVLVHQLHQKQCQPIHLLTVNHNVVLNNISLGLYRTIIDTRERFKKVLGRYQIVDIIASLWASLFSAGRQLHLSITSDTHLYFHGHASLVFLCANPLQWKELNLPEAPEMKTDEIGLIIVPAFSISTLCKLLWSKVSGKKIDKKEMQIVIAKTLTIKVQSYFQRSHFKAVIDGEIVKLPKHIHLAYSEQPFYFLT